MDSTDKRRVFSPRSLEKFIERINNFDNEYAKLFDYMKMERYKNWDQRGGLFFYRGENSLNKSRTANLFRNKGTDYIPLSELISDYERETAGLLDKDEKQVLLAHGQHHGLATNLLDITTNPLVALFFACYDSPENDGYVYLFQKDLTIELPPDLLLTGDKTFRQMVEANEDLFYNISSQIDRMWRKQAYFKNEKHYSRQLLYRMYDKVNEYSNIDADDKIFIKGFEIKEDEHLLDYFKNNYSKENIDWTIGVVYLKMLCLYLKYRYLYENDEISNILNFTYNPIMTFDRAKIQQGRFIYQIYEYHRSDIDNDQSIYSSNSYRYQKIKSYEKMIKIPQSSKEQILKDLDRLNINIKTVYGDFNSIAKYLNAKDTLKESKGEKRVHVFNQ